MLCRQDGGKDSQRGNQEGCFRGAAAELEGGARATRSPEEGGTGEIEGDGSKCRCRHERYAFRYD